MTLRTIVSAMLVACCTREPMPPEPPIVEVDVDAGAGPFARACQNLKRLGCPEAEPNSVGQTCAQVMTRASWIAVVPTECIGRAPTVADVRACGTASSLRIRCLP